MRKRRNIRGVRYKKEENNMGVGIVRGCDDDNVINVIVNVVIVRIICYFIIVVEDFCLCFYICFSIIIIFYNFYSFDIAIATKIIATIVAFMVVVIMVAIEHAIFIIAMRFLFLSAISRYDRDYNIKKKLFNAF